MDEALPALLDRYRAADIDASYAAYDTQPADHPDEWGDLASWRQPAGASCFTAREQVATCPRCGPESDRPPRQSEVSGAS